VWAVQKDLHPLEKEGAVMSCGVGLPFFLLKNWCSEISIHTGSYLVKFRILSNETYVTYKNLMKMLPNANHNPEQEDNV
jgi:hypothetical protein